MQSTASPVATTTHPVSPSRLLAAFAQIPDPRRIASVIYPLPAILTTAVVDPQAGTPLCGHTCVLAIAEWAGDQRPERLAELGFPDGNTPCQSTLQRLFRKLDGHVLAQALSQVFAADVPTASMPQPRARGSQGVAIDGKAQRGRLHYESGGSPVHLLTAFCHEQGIVLAQEPIEQGADKAEAELTVAPALIGQIDWQGRVLTGDALFCQRQLCEQVLAAGGDYLLLVRANQPRLLRAIELLFAEEGHPLPLLDRREARTIDQGHGRTADTRQLVASTDLVGYLDWPGHAQVFRWDRTWIENGERDEQIRYGITSLPPEIGSAERLLTLKRGHWSIENRLHRTTDVTFGEDASQIHVGQGPTIFAQLRSTAISLLHRTGCREITARLRRHSRHPEEAVALVLTDPPTRA